MILRYAFALFSLVTIGVLAWKLKKLQKYECSDRRCILRDNQFLGLAAEIGTLNQQLHVSETRGKWLAHYAQKERALRERAEERLLAAEAAVYLRRES